MKKRLCYSDRLGCADRRVHHEQPEVPRGPQYVNVPDDFADDRPVFCSIECALRAGFTTLQYGPPCPVCNVHHGENWKCSLAAEREACYQAARGSNDTNAFNKFGNRQLYWKGRSDAATAIRNRK